MASSLPKSPRRPNAASLTTTSIVSFSLTLLAASIAVLSGLGPLKTINFGERVDLGALLFLMPVVALVLAVSFEVVHVALHSSDLPEPRRQQAVRWSPGRREG